MPLSYDYKLRGLTSGDSTIATVDVALELDKARFTFLDATGRAHRISIAGDFAALVEACFTDDTFSLSSPTDTSQPSVGLTSSDTLFSATTTTTSGSTTVHGSRKPKAGTTRTGAATLPGVGQTAASGGAILGAGGGTGGGGGGGPASPVAPYGIISWAAVTGAASYKLYYGSTRSGNYPSSLNVGLVTSYALGSLTPGSTYFCAVTAVDAAGVESPKSKEISFVVPVAAQVKYVAKTGNDTTGDGTFALPWLTIQKAMNVANAGDTILVRAGTYTEKLVMARSGSAGSKIVFRPYKGEIVNLSGTGLSYTQYEPHITFNAVHHIRFQGFNINVNAASWNTIYLNAGCHHIEIVGNDIAGSTEGAGIFSEPANGGSAPASKFLFAGNHIHGNGNGGITLYQGDGTAGYVRIFNNVVHDDTSVGANFDGVQIGSAGGGTNHIVVKGNEIYREGNQVGADVLDLGGHSLNHHYLVEDNFLHDPLGYAHFKCHSGDNGTGNTFVVGTSGFHIVRFNVLKGIEWDMYNWPNPVAAYNNTYYDSGEMQQFGFYGGTSPAPVSLGSTAYASWKTSTGQGDTDTGRLCMKNSVMFQSTSYSNALVNYGAPLTDLTYKSVRWQGNMYRPAGSQYFSWYPNTYPMTGAGLLSLQGSASPNNPDTSSVIISTAAASMYRNVANYDFRLLSTSPAVNAAIPLTQAVTAGTSSTSLTVDRASWFCDGYPSAGELMTEPDVIQIGSSSPVAITAINDATNVITLAEARTWSIGTPVTLYGLTDKGHSKWVSDSQLSAPAGFLALSDVITS